MKGKLVIIDGVEFDEYEVCTVSQVATIRERVLSQQEIAEQSKQQRISELKVEIANKKLLDMDCTEEQNELRGLLGL